MSHADPSGGGRGPQPVPENVDVDQTFDVDGLHALRSTVAAHASHLGVPDLHIEALVIIAGELATNAIRHGGGSGRLRLWHDDTSVCLEVSDSGPGIADSSVGTVPPHPEHEGGRGLWIVRNLAAGVTIAAGPSGRGAIITATVHHTITDPHGSNAPRSEGRA